MTTLDTTDSRYFGHMGASASIVNPDGEGALISVRIDEDLTLRAARELASALAALVDAAAAQTDRAGGSATVELGNDGTFTSGMAQRNVVRNVTGLLAGADVDVETLVRLANALGVDPMRLLRDPS